MDAVVLAQALEILKRVGKSGDAAGAATLFARLAQVAGYTDTLEAILGLTNEAANGTGDIMQRLAQLILYTDTVEGVIGTNADAAATNASIWAMLKTLNQSTAKVDKSACIPFGTPGAFVALTNVYQTLQSITGKGFLDTTNLVGATAINTLRITVDGVVKFEGSSNSSSYSTGLTKRDLLFVNNGNAITIISPAGVYSTQAIASTNGSTVGYPYTANAIQAGTLSITPHSIYFNSSLLIEAKTGTALTAGYYIAGGYQP
jgi:hypothetical protein